MGLEWDLQYRGKGFTVRFLLNASRLGRTLLGASLLVFGAGCASFNPTPMEEVGFLERAESKTEGDLTVSAVVLSQEEARAAFDSKLYKKKIQPVWLQIENRSQKQFWFLPRDLDADYFSAFEVAWKSHRMWAKSTNQRIDQFFDAQQMFFSVPPESVSSGFVFTNRNRGAKWVSVTVMGEDAVENFGFLLEIPGFKADFHQVDPERLPQAEELVDLDEEGLRHWVGEQQCCVTNAQGTVNGDPLNIVVVGTDLTIWPAFIRAGWTPTASMRGSSILKTGAAGIFGTGYRYAPISPLYLFGRPQDIALQKARDNVHERNHLRLWLAPVTFRGKPVMIGQISRDIGTRLTTKSSTLTTHKIDPDVDETRAYLTQDLLYSQALQAWGHVDGGSPATFEAPSRNLTGDPYFTDGMIAVYFLTDVPTSALEVEYLDWEVPPPR